MYSHTKCDSVQLCYLLRNNLVIIVGNVLFTVCLVCLMFLVGNYSLKQDQSLIFPGQPSENSAMFCYAEIKRSIKNEKQILISSDCSDIVS